MSQSSAKVTAKQFYPYYLGEHQHVMSRRLHVAGSAWGLYCLQKALCKPAPTSSVKHMVKHVGLGLLGGYGCAWVGHFFFEKNKPATFDYPLQSFAGDWMMFKDVLTGKLSLTDTKLDKLGFKDIAEL